jgi:hypothetical protein
LSEAAKLAQEAGLLKKPEWVFQHPMIQLQRELY